MESGLTLTLEGKSRDAHVARSEARAFFATNRWAAPYDDALLVISELVTNAVLHGGGPLTVTLESAPPDVIITVTDRGAADPARRHPKGDDECGRGLDIVDRLSASWHVVHAVGFKTIVAVVRSTQCPSPTRSGPGRSAAQA